MTEISPEPSTSRSYSESSNFENVPPEEKYKGDSFNWEKYLEEMGCYSSTHSPLWKHCSLMEKQVFDVLFDKGLIIFVQKNGNIRPASIILSLGLECNVEYQDVSHNDSDWVSIDQILTDPLAAREREKEVLVQVNTPLTFVNMKDVRAHREVLDQELHTLIKPGMYFELKDPHDPERMYIAKVVSANGGIVAYTTLESQGIIHLHDPRCHPLGWTRSHPKECEYHPGYPANIIEEVINQGVPRICFEKISMEPHNLEVSNLVEVLDGHSGQFTYPAHISQIISPRYAVADVYTNQQVAPEKILVTKNAPGIYPQNFSLQNKIHMQTPLKMSKMGQEFSWINYKNMAKVQRAVSAVENCLNAPNTQKIHCMQYVEFFCYDIGVMTHALIVKSKLDSIWLMTGLNKSAQAVHCFFGSTQIFPAGFASKYNIPFCATMDIANLLPPKPENPEFSRFKLEQDFRPIPPPIFRKVQYSGRGRPERTWHFMPDWNIRGDNWLPNTYINRGCRLGIWLDSKAFAGIRDEFPKGSIADVIEIIFREFFRCTKADYKQDVVTTFDISDPKQVIPKQMVKYRFKMEGWSVTLSACESCENFPGWIQAFLQCYGCCPNLLTLDPNSPCSIGCSTVSDYVIAALKSENGKRPQIDGPPSRKRVRTNIPKPPRLPQGYFSGVVDAPSSRGQRLTGAIDVPEYVHWTKQRLVGYLMEHNPSMKVLLQQLENKRASLYEILQCRDSMAICRLGFKPRDAEKLAEALEGLRMAYR